MASEIRARLAAYHCDDVEPVSVNPRTGFPCRALLMEAWAPAGAFVRRRCKQCGAWKVVEVRPATAAGAAAAGATRHRAFSEYDNVLD